MNLQGKIRRFGAIASFGLVTLANASSIGNSMASDGNYYPNIETKLVDYSAHNMRYSIHRGLNDRDYFPEPASLLLAVAGGFMILGEGKKGFGRQHK